MAKSKKQSPQSILMEMLNGKHISRSVSLMAQLGISDMLANGPKSIEDLASDTQSDEHSLYRVMKLMTRLGVYKEKEKGVFENNEVSKFLLTKQERSLKNYAAWLGTSIHWDITRDLDYTVRTGTPSILKDTDKADVFEVLNDFPEAQEAFHDAMTSQSKADGKKVVDAYDWSKFGKIVDAGGGHGVLAKMIAESAPKTKVIIFDLPFVIEEVKPVLQKMNMDNLKAEGGSFLKKLPGKADAIIMKHILHDWNDEKAVEILKNCKKALNKGGKLIIGEMLLTEGPEGIPAQIFDIEMMMGAGGKERTKEEFEAILNAAGFKMSQLIDTSSPLQLIEAEVEES